jgi:hypothetical protein
LVLSAAASGAAEEAPGLLLEKCIAEINTIQESKALAYRPCRINAQICTDLGHLLAKNKQINI